MWFFKGLHINEQSVENDYAPYAMIKGAQVGDLNARALSYLEWFRVTSAKGKLYSVTKCAFWNYGLFYSA